jgi:hypothetical protein
MNLRGPPPPDAGASYLGAYGFGPWTLWLMRHAPELVAQTPTALLRGQAAPRCPLCRWPMVPRPGGWKCYRHDGKAVFVEQRPKFEKAPEVDVLSRVNEALDLVYDDGEWTVKPMELP